MRNVGAIVVRLFINTKFCRHSKSIKYVFDSHQTWYILQRLYYLQSGQCLKFCSYFLRFVFCFDFKILIIIKTCFSPVFSYLTLKD